MFLKFYSPHKALAKTNQEIHEHKRKGRRWGNIYKKEKLLLYWQWQFQLQMTMCKFSTVLLRNDLYSYHDYYLILQTV